MLRAGAQQGASASGGDLAIMLVVEVYNKAEWSISGDSDDTEGRAKKSEFLKLVLLRRGQYGLLATEGGSY